MINIAFEPELEVKAEPIVEASTPGRTRAPEPEVEAKGIDAKNAATQTDARPKTLTSWKILTTEPSLNTSAHSVGSSTSDYVILETHSWGVDAGCQTIDADLFRYNESQVRDMVMAWRVLTIFLPVLWYLVMYCVDQFTDLVVTVEFCSTGNPWWCGLGVTFLVLPSLFINAYSYSQLLQPDIASVAPLNKWIARALLVVQLAPHYLIARKVSWCYRAWRAQSWMHSRQKKQQQHQHQTRTQQGHRRTPKELWEQARVETDSNTAKWFQSLLESVPQLSVQTYVLMLSLTRPGGTVSPALVVSALVSLTSASSGLASVLSDRAWERVAASVAIYLTLGSRVLVCGGVGTIHPAYWMCPVLAATAMGLVAKVCETSEETWLAVLAKAYKYVSEGFVMATVCPPFNAVGLFSSMPYVLAGLVFLTLDPSAVVNVMAFVLSILGQSAWLALGFFAS